MNSEMALLGLALHRGIALSDTEALRPVIERRHKTSLWGQRRFVTPRLVDEIFGDGLQVIFIAPLATRPNYYVVRIDSSWGTDNWERDASMPPSEWVDDVLQAIEEEFGATDYDAEEDVRPFPVLHEDCGVSWGEVFLDKFMDR